MAKINVESGGTILSTGLLQLSGGAAMSTTLTTVTDQNNTASQLKLATNLTQVAGTLQIALDGGSYIDAQDVSGIDRFNVNRSAGSQQVNVDFSSNPTSGTDAVGALRTYANGVALSEAITFARNGSVGIGTTTPASGVKLNIKGSGTTSSTAPFYVQNGANLGVFAIQDDTQILSYASKFNIRSTGGDYGGWFQTNATQSLQITNNVYNNGTACALNLNGIGVLINSLPTNLNASARLHVVGSGSTAATTSLLVQNSAGSNALTIKDDRSSSFVGSSAGATFSIQNVDSTGFSGIEYLDNSGSLAVFTGYKNGGTGEFRFNNVATNGFITFKIAASDKMTIANSGSVGIGTTSPNASSLLEISSTTKGFLPPRMTNAQRAAIAAPAVGLMVYCTDAVEGLYIYKSTGWTFVI